MRSYLICTTPRTGSYLLCEALKNTGVAGRPTEYFSGGFQHYWMRRWGIRGYAAYLRRVIRIGTTGNGVFGVKVHSMQFDHFVRQVAARPRVPVAERRALLERWLPDPTYIWLRREDRLRQAISYAKALQTKIWWDADQPPAPYDAPRPEALQFDRDLIERMVVQLERWDASWRLYFDAHRIEPFVLSYEQLTADVERALRDVVMHLGLELPAGFALPPSQFRRQADEVTEEWLARYERSSPNGSAVPRKGASPGSPAAAPGPVAAGAIPPAGLDAILANRRWWLCTTPFRHLRAQRVFVPEQYEWMAADFRDRLAADRLGRNIPGYDASALGITPANAGAFAVFISRAWRDLIARLLAPDSTDDVNVTLHHHAVGSRSGVPHNDLNPGWFIEGGAQGAITVSDHAVCSYKSGETSDGQRSVERVRSVALIYYLANPDAYTGWGGATGLYARGSDPVERPVAAVPPRNNSLVAFECTPFSYHSFMTNPQFERNSVVMWLHRRKEEVVRRWGEQSIVGW